MKVVRYAVVQAPEGGLAVMRLCPQWYAHGACRYELWCDCRHSCGGPLRDVVRRFESLPLALEFAEISERNRGGVREVNCEDAKHVRGDVLPDFGDWEVPY